jgi:hypothetical protein
LASQSRKYEKKKEKEALLKEDEVRRETPTDRSRTEQNKPSNIIKELTYVGPGDDSQFSKATHPPPLD